MSLRDLLQAGRGSGAVAVAAIAIATAAAMTSAPLHTALAQETRGTIVLSRLPSPGSPAYEQLLSAAGTPRIEALGMSKSEAWVVEGSRIEALMKVATDLGVEAQPVTDGAQPLLSLVGNGVSMTAKQSEMMALDMASRSTMAVRMAMPMNAAMSEYALAHGMDQKDHPTPPVIRIPLSEAETVDVRRVSVSKNGNGYAWRGEIQGSNEPVTLLWWPDGHVSGSIRVGGRVFTVKNATGGMHEVVEKSMHMLPPDHAPANRELLEKMSMEHDPLVMKGDASAMRSAMRAHGTSTDRMSMPAEEIDKAKDAPALSGEQHTSWPMLDRQSRAESDPPRAEVVITLLVAYTPAVAKRYEDPARDLVALAVEEANQSFRNSGLGFIRLELVHAYETAYVEDGSHFDHVWRFADKGDGYLDEVHGLRDRFKADVAVLMVHDPHGCGLATRVAADADEAFAVVHHECSATSYSLAHEVGHIIGARHDIALDNTQKPFAFGHGYVHGTKWRTMMSYQDACNGCPRLPVWSNPRINIGGIPAGNESSDNARVLAEQAARVAGFR